MRASFLFLLIVPLTVKAQFTVSGSVGYGSFRMHDMKLFQKELKNGFPVNAQITSSFPSFWFYELSAIRSHDEFTVGGSAYYTSTGGRIYYSDYSGMVASDQLLNAFGITAIFGGTISSENKKLSLTGDLRPGIVRTNLDLIFKEEISSPRQTTKLSFHSFGFTFQPTLTLNGKLGRFGLNILAGYQLGIAGKLYYEDDKEAFLTHGNDDAEVKVDWSGFRTSVGLSFDLIPLL